MLEGSDGITVPTFSISKINSTFVRVLRCKSTYQLKSSIGVDLKSLDEFTKYEDMKWIWNKASGDPSNCKFLGTHVHRDRIQDMAADSGEFYYLINPCVSKKRSTINKEGCSNDLYKTASISYESTLKKTFLAIAHELSDLEIKVGTTVENIKVLATQIMFEQEACEKIAATKAANVGFFRGIAQLVAGTVGGVVGAMFGGPIGAVQGATSFMGIARNLLLKFGPQVKLDCSSR